jgi:uncharacterized repeat protein (TIGR01451 family)
LFALSLNATVASASPSLGGVSCDSVEAKGVEATEKSLRGVTRTGQPLPTRSGFDYLTAFVWVRNAPASSCPNLLNEAFVCIHTAGNIGDSDGDGSYSLTSFAPCGDPSIPDADNANHIVADFEAYTFGIDRDCNGQPDLIFRVTSDQLSVLLDLFGGFSGEVIGGRGDNWQGEVITATPYANCPPPPGEVNGRVIIRIPNFNKYFQNLSSGVEASPALFNWNVNGGNSIDAPPEDSVRGSLNLAAPAFELTKTPNLSLCPTNTGTFTIRVENTGNTTLSNIQVSDILPAGVSFCDTPPTFSTFNLQPCESKSFDVCVRNDVCNGTVQNTASAQGEFRATCLGQENPQQVGPVTTTADIVCLVVPCVDNVTAQCSPETSCPGLPIRITGSARNCSSAPETIILTVEGTPHTCPDVPAGGLCEFSVDRTMPECTPGSPVTFHVSAIARNSQCPGDTPPGTAQCEITCSAPDIDVEKTAEPTVSSGGTIHYVITVTNRSTVSTLENVVVTDDVCNNVAYADQASPAPTSEPNVGDIDGTIVWNIASIAPNTNVVLRFQGTALGNAQACSEEVTCRNTVTAVGFCGDARDEDTDSFDTRILPPCVDDVRALCSPENACAGVPVRVTGSARNCSVAPETIILTVDGTPHTCEDVSPGERCEFTVDRTMPECSPGSPVTFVVSAIARRGGCDTPPGTAQCEINCSAPDIDVEKTAEPTVSTGGTIHYVITVTNRSSVSTLEDVVVTDDLCNNVAYADQASPTPTSEPNVGDIDGTIVWNIASIAPNSNVQLRFQATAVADAQACSEEVTCTNRVTAVGFCGDSRDEDTDTFDTRILPACVDDVRAVCSPEAACPGQPIRITGSARNCSTAPETIVLTVDGNPHTCTDVDPGERCEFSVDRTMPACTPGSPVTFTVSAIARRGGCDTPPVTAQCEIDCSAPDIDVEKTAESTVDIGGTIHYVITVTNKSTTSALERVVVTDELCSNAKYVGASPSPTSEPPVGQIGGSIVWEIASIGPRQDVVLRCQATAVNDAQPCTQDVTCTNEVTAVGFCGDARDEATATAPTVIPCPPQEVSLCRLTGGGCLNETRGNKGHKDHTFGGNVSPLHSGGGPTGNEWEHVVREGNQITFNFHSHDAHIDSCDVLPPGPCSPHGEITRAFFSGTGVYSKGPGTREFEACFTAIVVDHNEGSCNRNARDEYGIHVVQKGPGCPTSGTEVFDLPLQPLKRTDCGNLQIHETPARIFSGLGSGTTTRPAVPRPTPTKASGPDEEPAQVDDLRFLNRAVPNPFSGTTTYTYRVPDGVSQPVEVSVYSVAGRLVSRLTSGTQSPGIHTVRWEGRSDDGTKMSQGIYFIRARIGAQTYQGRLVLLR